MANIQGKWPKIDQGPPWLQGAFNDLVDVVRSMWPVSSPECAVVDVPGGKSFFPAVRSGGNGDDAIVVTHPFKGIDASDDDGVKIRVVYGTVLGLEPVGMSVGDDPQYVIGPLDASGRAWVGMTFDYDAMSNVATITSRFIDVGATVPDDVLPGAGDETGSGTVYRQLFNWTNGDTILSIAQDVTTSLWFALCGGNTAEWGPA